MLHYIFVNYNLFNIVKFSKFDTRKALKPLIKDEKLNQDTLIAVQAEKERKKRIEERKKKVLFSNPNLSIDI